MIVTIVLIVTAITFFIGATIYSKSKTELTSNSKKGLKKKRKTLLNLWGITKINSNSLIVNNATSIIIELKSINYDFMSEDEKNSIDMSLANIVKTIKFPVQFFSTKRNINIEERIEEIKNSSSNRNVNLKIKKYAEYIMEYLEEIKENTDLHIEKDYMIITSYDESKKAEKDLKYFYESLKNNLKSINIETHLLESVEIVELLQKELNSSDEEIVEKVIEEGGLDLYVISKTREENQFKYENK